MSGRPKRVTRYRDDYDYDDRRSYPRRVRRWNWLKVVLVVFVCLLAIPVGYIIFVELWPYRRFVPWIILFLLVAGAAWIVFQLYGILQDKLNKKEQRDIIRIQKDEQVAFRPRRTTKNLQLLGTDEPELPQRTRRQSQYLDYQQQQNYLPSPQPPPPDYAYMQQQYPPPPQQQYQEPPPADTTIYFANVRGSIQPGQILLGIRQDQTLRIGTWEDVKTVFVLGSMASGKSTTMASLTAQAADSGMYIVPCDIHIKKNDSFIRKIEPLAPALYPETSLAYLPDDILRNARVVRNELDERIKGKTWRRKIVLAIDELNTLLDDEDIAKELLQILSEIGRQGRDFGIYVIAGGQELTYTRIKKKFIAYIVHRVDETESRLVLPSRFVKLTPELPNGLTIVKDAYGQTELLQQALITNRDIQLIASSHMPYPSQPRYTQQLYPRNPYENYDLYNGSTLNDQAAFQQQTPFRSVDSFPKQPKHRLETRLDRLPQTTGTPFSTPQINGPKLPYNPNDPDAEKYEQAIVLARGGVSRRKIKDKLGFHGAKYEILRQVLDRAGV